MLDTVKVHSRDFEVGTDSPLEIRQGIINHSTGEEKNSFFLFKDRSGNYVNGAGAYLNHNLFNLDINKNGMFLKFTPAKVFYGCNYYSVNNNQLKLVTDEIQEELKRSDIHIDLKETALSRVDLARNIHTDKPIPAYQEMFSFLSGQRMKSVAYPEYYRYGNRSRQIVFYDKISELTNFQKININDFDIPDKNTLRGELRFLSGSVCKRDLPYTKLGDLYKKSNYEDIKDSYKYYLKKLVFKSGVKDEKVKFHFNKEVEILQEMRKAFKRNAINEYFNHRNFNFILNVFGSLDNFRSVLIEAGFERTYVYRRLKKLEKGFYIVEKIEEKYNKDRITNLYEEITNKFLN